jgi:drug/metabolite transporter (DMT)-like permease
MRKSDERVTAPGEAGWVPWVPVVFVALWSSGFLACKAALADSGPFTLLVLRFGLAAVTLAAVAVLWRAPWPASRREAMHVVVAGVLMHAIYLGPNFYAVSRGVPVGINALVGALQPLLTAVLASRFLGEAVRPLQWAGLVLGVAGIAMVVFDRIAFDAALWPEFVGTLAALVSITVGTLYQKHFCPRMDLRSGPALQFAAATAVVAVPMLLFEGWQVEWTASFAGALAWLVLLSATLYGILIWLFRRGAATRVASLFFLVPPVTSAAAWWLFGDRLGPLALAGMAVTVVAVALAMRK